MIEQIPLFACLDEAAHAFLKTAAVKKTFPKNTILFSKGDDSNALYVIQKGKVKAIVSDEDGKEMILNIHGPGEYIGEVALLDGKPRSATVITKEPTQVWIIYRKDFMHVLSISPALLLEINKMILERLRLLTDKIESIAFQNVYGRIVNFLLQMSTEKDNVRVIREKLTHQEIANMVGSSREMVSKILKELETGGYLTIEKKMIIITRKLPMSF